MTTATIERIYSSAEVCASTGATYRELEWWKRHGLIRPSAQEAYGSGDVNRWTDRDLQVVQALKLLRLAGVELEAIRVKGISRLRADLEAALGYAETIGLQ